MLWLVGQIIDHSNPQEEVLMWFPGDDLFTPSERRRGLPSATRPASSSPTSTSTRSTTSSRTGSGQGYVRYVDDFLVFADDKRRLARGAGADRAISWRRLRLRLHPDKSVVFPVEQGIRFLGYRVFPTHRLLAKENVRRFRRRMRWMQREYAAGRIGFDADPPPDHELDRPRPPSQHLSPA